MPSTRNNSSTNAAVNAPTTSADHQMVLQDIMDRLSNMENRVSAQPTIQQTDSNMEAILRLQQEEAERRRREELDKAPEVQKRITYDGTQRHLRQFLQDLENAHAKQTCVENRNRHLPTFIPGLRQYFVGPAAAWFRNWTEQVKNQGNQFTWNLLKKALQEVYQDEFEHISIWKEIYELKMGSGDFIQYVQRFKALTSELNMPLDENSKHVLFLNGLPRGIIEDLEAKGFKKMEDMEELGMRAYKKWERRQSQRDRNPGGWEGRRKTPNYNRERASPATTFIQQRDQSSKKVRFQTPENQSQKRFRTNRNPLTAEQRQRLFQWVGTRCTRCAKDGHYGKNCTSSDDVQETWRREKSNYIQTNILKQQ